jgi:PAS domain S-box-containing protein
MKPGNTFKKESKSSSIEKKYESLFHNSLVGNGFGLPDGTLIDCNDAFAHMLGYTKEEMLKINLVSLYTNPEDRERAKKILIKEGKLKNFEATVKHKNGSIVHLLMCSNVITINNETFFQTSCLDITDKKVPEQKLKESEAKLSNAMQIARLGHWEYDFAEDLFTFNDQFYDIFHTSAEKMGGYKLSPKQYAETFLHPDDREMVAMEMQKSRETDDPNFNRLLEHRIIYADGGVGYISVRYFIVKDDQGNTIKTYGANQDITDRKKTEQALIDSNKKNQEILDNTRIQMWAFDGEYYNYMNKEWYEYTGQDPLFPLTIDRWTERVHPDDLEEALRVWNKNLKGKTPHVNYFRLRRKDGIYRSFYCRAVPIYDTEGKFKYFQGFNLDITEYKKAEQDLIESEERFKALHNASFGGIAIHDKGIILECNQGLSKLTGFSQDELLGADGVNLLITGESHEIVMHNILSGYEKPYEALGIRKNGEKYPIRLEARQIPYKGKKVRVVEFRDITEQKKAVEAIKESEIKFRTLVNQASEMLFFHDLDGNLIEVNESAIKNTGYSRDELEKMTVFDIDKEAHDRDDMHKYWKSLNPGDPPITFEATHKCKDGSTYPVEIVVSKIDYSGNHNILGLGRNIAERKKAEEELKLSEERFKQLSNLTFEGILIHDKGMIIDTNQSLLEMFGYKREEVLGKSIFEIALPKEYHEEVIGYFQSKFVEPYEIEGIKKDGTRFWAEILAREINLGNKELRVAAIRDVTRRREAEIRLKQAKEKAEESDRLKSAFLANMSHEIRTPMNGILGFSNLLKTPGLKGADQRKYIDIIEKSGERLLNIIDDIVEISKIESGTMEVTMKETHVNKKLEYIHDFFQPEATRKGLNLSLINKLPEREAKIITDEDKVSAILMNLVKNAIKYTDKGFIEFGCNYLEMNHSGFLQFSVKDTGIGIAKERQEVIFERFIQADIEDVDARQGAGLGLAISKAYAEMLGGKLWVASHKGKGSTFYFTIPFTQSNHENEIAVGSQSVDYEDTPNLNLKILVAEDDESSVELITTLIKDCASKIVIAKNGKEAVETCRNNPDIDLVLMDILMPGLNGYKATQQIRRFNKKVVIIAQTAYGLAGDRDKAIEAGCNDYIAKPVKKEELFKLMQEYFTK